CQQAAPRRFSHRHRQRNEEGKLDDKSRPHRLDQGCDLLRYPGDGAAVRGGYFLRIFLLLHRRAQDAPILIVTRLTTVCDFSQCEWPATKKTACARRCCARSRSKAWTTSSAASSSPPSASAP